MIEERIVNHITVHPHWLCIGVVIAFKQLVEALKTTAEFYWNWKDRNVKKQTF